PRSLITIRRRRRPALPLRHRRRVRRRHSPRPPSRRATTGSGVPRQQARQRVRTAPRAISARFDPVITSRRFTTLVPRVRRSISLTGPAPSGSTGTSRPRRGCSPPPRQLPDQAASSFSGLLRQATGEGLSPPHGQPAPRGALAQVSGHLLGQRPL